MGFIKDFMDNHHCPLAVAATHQPKGEDMYENNIVSDIVDMKDWEGCLFIVKKTTGATGTATATINACDNNTPSNTSGALTFWYRSMTTQDTWASDWATSASLAITAGSDEIWEILITGDQVAAVAEYSYIKLTLTETESTAQDGAVVTMLVGPKYATKGSMIPSVLD